MRKKGGLPSLSRPSELRDALNSVKTALLTALVASFCYKAIHKRIYFMPYEQPEKLDFNP